MKARVINNYKKISTAFTLAEVLVTLTVIGVIAALTIPSLIQNIQDAQYKTAYKKAFSDVNQAFLRAKSNSEFIDNNNTPANAVTNIRTLEKYFNVIKSCTDSNTQGCWIDNCHNGEHDCFWALSSETVQGDGEGFIDNSGRQWTHYRVDAGWLILMVDTNGAKTPNRIGRDRFPIFFMDENGLTNATAPIKVSPYPYGDIIPAGLNCLFGNCYYTSWLKQ